MKMSKEQFDALTVGDSFSVKVMVGVEIWRAWFHQKWFTTKRTITKITPKRTRITLDDGTVVKVRESSWGLESNYFLTCGDTIEGLWDESFVDQTKEMQEHKDKCDLIQQSRRFEFDIMKIENIDKAVEATELMEKLNNLIKEQDDDSEE